MAQMGTVEEEEEGGSTKGEDIVMDTDVSASGYNNQPFLLNRLMIVLKGFDDGYCSPLILKPSHSVWSY